MCLNMKMIRVMKILLHILVWQMTGYHLVILKVGVTMQLNCRFLWLILPPKDF